MIQADLKMGPEPTKLTVFGSSELDPIRGTMGRWI